jgi:uncharacterized protein
MTRPHYEQAWRYARDRLAAELSPLFTYHSLWHTESEVVRVVDQLARASGLSEDERLLLQTAAWFHDLGCVVQRFEHEAIGVGIVDVMLPGWGYSPAQVRAVQDMIMATRLPQSPRTALEELLADADLDVLGRADYFERNAVLRDELARLGAQLTDLEWCRDQQRFLIEHHYFSPAARQLREAGKQRNIAQLSIQLANLSAQG